MLREAAGRGLLQLILISLSFLGATRAMAGPELVLAVYGGASTAQPSDVTIRQAGGTDLTLHDVEWQSESLKMPIYYGARLLFWLPKVREAGFGLDFTHVKALANNGQAVQVRGTRIGVTRDGWERVDASARDLGFSHGLNFLTALMLHRFFVKETFHPYLGIGLGISIPHVEGYVGGTVGDAYHFGGLAYQAQLGLEQRVLGQVALFLEYKLNYSKVDVPFDANTQVTTEFWVHQAVAGIGFHFGGQP